jgi:hypothetical protein
MDRPQASYDSAKAGRADNLAEMTKAVGDYMEKHS